MEAGVFALTGVGNLANVTVAFPGEHWSDKRASGVIVPGEAIVPVQASGDVFYRTAGSGDAAEKDRICIAKRPVEHPDVNTGPGSLGPNEIVNQAIADGDYVHRYYSGVFHLTLIVPDTYVPGDRIGWDANGARPAGKAGAGAWAKDAAADIDSIFEVMTWRPYGTDDEGILTVRTINRGQF